METLAFVIVILLLWAIAHRLHRLEIILKAFRVTIEIPAPTDSPDPERAPADQSNVVAFDLIRKAK